MLMAADHHFGSNWLWKFNVTCCYLFNLQWIYIGPAHIQIRSVCNGSENINHRPIQNRRTRARSTHSWWRQRRFSVRQCKISGQIQAKSDRKEWQRIHSNGTIPAGFRYIPIAHQIGKSIQWRQSTRRQYECVLEPKLAWHLQWVETGYHLCGRRNPQGNHQSHFHQDPVLGHLSERISSFIFKLDERKVFITLLDLFEYVIYLPSIFQL